MWIRFSVFQTVPWKKRQQQSYRQAATQWGCHLWNNVCKDTIQKLPCVLSWLRASVQLRHQYNYTSECKSSQITSLWGRNKRSPCWLHLYNIIQTSICVVCSSWLYVNEDILLVLDPNNNCCPIALPSLPNSLSNKARLYTCCKDTIQWLPYHNSPAY